MLQQAVPHELTPKQAVTDYLRFLQQLAFSKLEEQWEPFNRKDATAAALLLMLDLSMQGILLMLACLLTKSAVHPFTSVP